MTTHANQLNDKEKNLLLRLDDLIPSMERIHTVLESKARFNFTMMSIIAGIWSSVNIDVLGRIPNQAMILLFALFCLCYIAIVGLSIYILWPRERPIMTVKPDRSDISTWVNWARDESNTYLTETLATYVSLWKDSQKAWRCKACATKASYLAIALGMTFLIVELIVFVNQLCSNTECW